LSSSILDISTVVSVPREVALEALMVGVERADLVYNGALQPDVSLMTCSGGVFEDVCTVF
jgi:hypothetical protein